MSWGLVAVAGATVAGSVIGGNKAEGAAQTGADSSAQQLAFQKEYYKPIMDLQSAAQPMIMDMISGKYDPTSDPFYQRNVNLASQNILGNAAVSDSVRGGNAIGAMGAVPMQMAQQSYNQRMGNLMGIMGMDAGINQMSNTMNNASMIQQQNALFQGQNMSNMLGSLGGIAYEGFKDDKF